MDFPRGIKKYISTLFGKLAVNGYEYRKVNGEEVDEESAGRNVIKNTVPRKPSSNRGKLLFLDSGQTPSESPIKSRKSKEDASELIKKTEKKGFEEDVCSAEKGTLHGNGQRDIEGTIMGFLLATLSGFLSACTGLFVKLARSLSYVEMFFATRLGIFVYILPIMIYFTFAFCPTTWKDFGLIVCRALLGSFAAIAFYFSVVHIPLGDATAILFTNPVWAAVLAYFLLNESWRAFDCIAVLLSLAGMILIVRPTFLFPRGDSDNPSASFKWQPHILSLAASVAMAIALVCVRKMDKCGPFTVCYFYGFLGVLVSLVYAAVMRDVKLPDCGTRDKYFAVLAGITECFAQVTVIYALTIEKTAIVALGRASDIGFAFLLENIFISSSVNGYGVTGIALIVLCNVVIFLNKMYGEKLTVWYHKNLKVF